MSVTPNHFKMTDPPVQIAIGIAAAALLFYMQLKLDPLVIVGITLIPLILLASFRHPYMAAILFMSFSFFRFHEAYPFLKPLRLILATSLLSLVVLSWHAFIARTIKPVWTKELTLLMIFFALVTLGLPFAYNRDLSYIFWQNSYIKIILMVPVIAWLIRSASDFNWTNRIIVLSGILISARAIYNKIYGIGLVEGTRVTIGREEVPEIFNLDDPSLPLNYLFHKSHTSAVLSDPNDLALILLFPLGFAAVSLIYRTGFLNKIFGTIGVPMIILAIIATQSRGGLLGILAVLGTIGLKMIKSKLALGMIGLVAFSFLFLAMGIKDRQSGGSEDIARNGGIDASSEGRIIAWQAAAVMAIKRPLTGVGVSNFTDAFRSYTLTWPGTNKAVHSTWFGVLGETGFPGIIVFLAMIGTIIKTTLKDNIKLSAPSVPQEMKAASLAQMAGVASFCTAGTFLTQAFTWPIYILLALTVALHQYTNNLPLAENGELELTTDSNHP